MHKITLLSLLMILIAITGWLAWRFPYAITSLTDKGNMLYMLILAVVMGSSCLLGYRGRFTTFIQHSLLWGAIILIILGGYSYRYEIMNSRIMSSLLPQRAIIGEGGTMIFRAAQDGHFYIEATINNVAVNFMVDTGASDVTIAPSDAARLGIDLQSLNYTRTYNTANGVVNGAPVVLQHFTVGDINIDNMPASINGTEMDRSLLGMSFFQRLQGFSVQGDRLTITP